MTNSAGQAPEVKGQDMPPETLAGPAQGIGHTTLPTEKANGDLGEEPRSSSTDVADKELKVANESPSNSSDPAIGAALEKTPSEVQRSKWRIVLIMGSLCIAVFLAALDITIVTTAIPTISSHFHASNGDYAWIGSAYLLAAAAATPSWGKFSDIFGRKPMILLANVIFLVGSIIAATSASIKQLIAARVIQGVGGGGLIVLANVCISDLFHMRERSKYFGVIGAVWGVSAQCP